MYAHAHKCVVAFYVICQHWNGTGECNPFSWKTVAKLYCIANVLSAEDSAMQARDWGLCIHNINFAPKYCIDFDEAEQSV